MFIKEERKSSSGSSGDNPRKQRSRLGLDDSSRSSTISRKLSYNTDNEDVKSSSVEIIEDTPDATYVIPRSEEPNYLKSKVEIKAEATKDNNGDSEIQQGTSKNGHKTSKNSKKVLREKVKENLERLAKKAAKEQESEVNVDLTKSQKEIQKLENLLDAAQVGHVHQFAIPYMYLLFSVTRETFWSKVTCAVKDVMVPDPFLSLPPLSTMEPVSTSQDSCKMKSLRGKTELSYWLKFISYLLLLSMFVVDFSSFQATLFSTLQQYLYNRNIFKSVSAKRVSKLWIDIPEYVAISVI